MGGAEVTPRVRLDLSVKRLTRSLSQNMPCGMEGSERQFEPAPAHGGTQLQDSASVTVEGDGKGVRGWKVALTGPSAGLGISGIVAMTCIALHGEPVATRLVVGLLAACFFCLFGGILLTGSQVDRLNSENRRLNSELIRVTAIKNRYEDRELTERLSSAD